MSPRSEELLSVALGRLQEARAACTSELHSSAVSAAYYSMLYAARAALSEEDVHAKTHRGTWSLFQETFVGTGRFDGGLLAEARHAQRVREASDYEAKVPGPEDAQASVDLAERFIQSVEELIG